ncbi:NUDIX hydrolase [Enterococcus sp. LJL120]
MQTKGAFTILTDAQEKILLVKRRDIPFWDLPGGGVESGETAEVAAIREVLEETGLEVVIEKKIGLYTLPKHQDQQEIFVGRICGGKLVNDGAETRAIKYFAKNQLPINLIPFRRRQITDFFQQKEMVTETLRESNSLMVAEFFVTRLLKFIK